MTAQNFFFIDPRVQNYQAFVAGLQATDTWVLLSSDQDGLDQMVRALGGVKDLASIQIISHGSQGALYLGATVLNSGNLPFYAPQLASIGSALTQSGDILLYGCNVAQDDVGVQFVNALAQATGADVAASDDATGASLLGGDTVLEQISGHVESASVALNGLNGLLAITSLPLLPVGNTALGGGSLPSSVTGSLPSSVTGSVSSNNDLSARVIEWTRFLGGRSSADSLTIGADGSIYMVGHAFEQLDGQTNSGKSDAFITRYNPDGTKAWTKLLGGAEHDIASGLTTGADGAIYMAGYTDSNLDGQTNSGGNDAFITRYNADGTKVWSKLLGGSGSDSAYSLTTGTDGAIYIAGQTSSNLNGQANSGGSDAFITRFNPNGTLAWTKLLGGSGYDQATSLTTGADGAIYMAGKTSSGAGDNFFITRYKPDGTKVWIQLMGASANDVLFSLTTGADGTIYMAGHTYANLDGQTNSGESDAFITRYNPDGTKVWTKLSGGSGSDFASSLTAGADGAIYMAGETSSNLDAQTNGGESKAYITSYKPDGTKAWTKLLNGNDGDFLTSMTTSDDGAIYLAGDSGSNAFITKLIESSANDVPSVTVDISGIASQGQPLIARLSRPEIDGLASGYPSTVPGTTNGLNTEGLFIFSYQWLANGVNIFGADSSTLLLSQAEVGKAISVLVMYKNDDLSPLVSVTSGVTDIVSNINDLPTGAVTISGKVTQGQTLSASNTLADIDGLGNITYQWKADGVNIAGATGATLTLAQAQVGKAITATASYTDGLGTAESKTSLASAAVVNVNDAPTGSVTIIGTAAQGQTLSAANSLADADGLGTVSYQWLADGANIGGATGNTFVLSQAQLGKAITVVASYTDMGNTLESVTSNTTALVFDTIVGVNAAPSFAPYLPGTGKAIIPVGQSEDYAQAITLQADGRILVAGVSYAGINLYDFSLVRLNANGSLDSSFDGDGKLIISLGEGDDVAYDMTLQADGKILLAGTSDKGLNGGFVIVRLNANGSLDTSFDGDGKAIKYVTSWFDNGRAMTLQADGKILVAGSSSSYNGNNSDFSLIRLNANGSLDTSFDGDGKAIIPVGTSSARASALTLQADGKILVAGTSYNGSDHDFSLIRLNANGSIDTSFGGDGKVIIPGAGNDNEPAMSLQADGKILVAGYSGNGTNEYFSVIRLNANGSLDSSFDGDGKAIISVGAGSANQRAMSLQADGKILVAVYSYNGFSLIRLNSNGSLDTSFDGDGKAIFPVGAPARDMTLQFDDKILVVGMADGLKGNTGFSQSDFSVIRLNADGSLDSSFGAAPGTNTLGGMVSYKENAFAIALDTTVEIWDPELSALNNGQGNYTGASVILARSTGANPQDVFGASGNLSFTGGNAVLSGTTIGSCTQSGGSLTIAFKSNATQARINEALSSLTYANSSDAPPASVQINWTFSDGNLGAQGSGGALTGAGSTIVNITAVNDDSTGSVTVSGTATQGQTLAAANTLADADGLGAISYQWQADGVNISGATGTTLTLAQDQVGKAITVTASYTDGQGAAESKTSLASAAVDNVKDLTGMLTTDIGSLDDRANSIALQADGKILLAGSSRNNIGNTDFALVRYGSNGSLDTSFSGDGKLTTDFGSSSDGATSLTLQANGKILLAGYSTNSIGNYDFALVRYNSDGSLDTSFSGDGMTTTAIGPSDDGCFSVKLQGDGKILLAGEIANVNNSGTAFGLVRYISDGSLDSSFSGDGMLTTDFGPSYDGATSMTLQPDGKILLAGYSTDSSGREHFALVRYTTDGSLDSSFSGDGMITTAIGAAGSKANSIMLQADGKILLAGSGSSQGNSYFSLVRYLSDGSLDNSFSGDGILTTDIGVDCKCHSVTLQADGKILLAGFSYGGGASVGSGFSSNFALVRYNSDGSLDSSFSGDGIHIGKASLAGRSFALQTDGKILLAGFSPSPGNEDFSVQRYNIDGGLDSGFGASAVPNNPPTGAVSISGTVTQGQTLSASNTLADIDGLGNISYQWKAGGTAIAGAIGSTLLLTQAEVGKAITVVASYTDGFGQAESVTSSATANVGNIGLPNIGSLALIGHAYDWKTHTLLSNVDVKLTSQIPATSLESKSGLDGSFGFDSLDAGGYKLEASKALTAAETGSAINSADALAALKIAVGRNPNADPDGDGPLTAPPVSPYQFIAADANQDGKVTSADALAILKMAVKRSDAPAREWLFVNENQDFWNEVTSSFTTTRSKVEWEKALQVSSPLTTQQNVVAVLKGDVNGSWTPPAGSQDLNVKVPGYFEDLATKLGTPANQWAVIG